MTSTSGEVVIDAGVLIGALAVDDLHHSWAVGALAEAGRDRIVVSALTLAEALVHPAAAGSAETILHAFLRLRPVVVDVSRADALGLAGIRATSRLRMPDVVVLHLAVARASAIATTDARLAQVAAERGLVVHTPAPRSTTLDRL